MKIKIFVEETVKYTHEVIIRTSNDVSEDELNRCLDKIQRRSDNVSDVASYLDDHEDIELLEVNEADLRDPHSWEIEITDYDIEEE